MNSAATKEVREDIVKSMPEKSKNTVLQKSENIRCFYVQTDSVTSKSFFAYYMLVAVAF